MTITTKHICAATLLVMFECRQVLAADQIASTPDRTPAGEQTTDPEPSAGKPATEKRGELAVAPIPVIDPTVGNGLAVAALYAARLNVEDKVSPPSLFAIGGLRTSNGTWALAGGAQLYLKQDRFRLLGAAGVLRANYNFYGIGNAAGDTIPITQSGSGLLVGGLVRVFERWYAGSRYYYFKVNTGLGEKSDEAGGSGDSSAPIREVLLKMPVAALALHIQRDTRKDQFYPRAGSVFDTKAYYSNQSVGALFTYEDYEVSFQQYLRLGERGVLAYRGKACAVNGHAPFFALCTLGNAADLRGYPVGRYRDRRMLVGQVEYRREIWWRFGFAAFAGAGQVAPTFTDFEGSNTRPGGGVGVRFVLAPKNHINLRVDYSLGQHSHAWYVGIGEAF